MSDNQFYGWYDDATQDKPTYEPPRDAPCPFCGCKVTPDDVGTTNIMYQGQYAARSYFYRMHRTCREKDRVANPTGNGMDDFIFAMIERNGD